jgi:hypothetical protein
MPTVAQHFVSDGRCQFCHATASNVEHMIAGDSGFICSGCVAACAALLRPSTPAAPAEERPDRLAHQRVTRHFAPLRPHDMLATSRSYPVRQQADLQAALDDLLGERRIPEGFVGIRPRHRQETADFAKLLEQTYAAVEVAPAQFEDVDIGRGETRRCLKNGLWLLRQDDLPYAVVLSQQEDYGQGSTSVLIEIAVPAGDAGATLVSRVFDGLESRLSAGSCYRGRVLSLEAGYQWSGHAGRIRVHDLEPVAREEVILPEDTLRTVERNVLRFAEQRPALRALGLSTQKGLLFHGLPGTGKTHCIRYLAGRLPGHTTLLITAEEMGILPEYMALARLLQPALVVIEDADLIARDRSDDGACSEVHLNRLLNELDGLRERADVFFVMTTNRPASLEPALASRPGRIDQAIEFPLPDESHRRRLLALYARTLPIPAEVIADLARRTEGASPAFIKEFTRRIAQHHLEAPQDADVSRVTTDVALHEMLFSGGVLNRALLGGAVTAADA